MTTQTMQLNIVEKALVVMCGLVWRFLRLLDPQRVQRYFAAKVNVTGHSFCKVHSLSKEDAIGHVCRINNNRMKQGEGFLAKRGDLLKVYNPANGKFVLRYAQGSGELRIRFKEIGLDYDARVELGVDIDEEVGLQVMKANPADREFYLMYQDHSKSSRQSRALGWYLFLGSIMFTLLSSAFGLASTLINHFF